MLNHILYSLGIEICLHFVANHSQLTVDRFPALFGFVIYQLIDRPHHKGLPLSVIFVFLWQILDNRTLLQ